MGFDKHSGKNFDHRKQWIEDKLKQLAVSFGIDLFAFSCMSNHFHFHFHLLLRSRPDVVATWDDTQVSLRWWQLCPTRKVKRKVDGKWIKVPAEPTEVELNAIRNDPIRLATIKWIRIIPLDRLERNAGAKDALAKNVAESNALERSVSRVEDVRSHGTECRATLVQVAENSGSKVIEIQSIDSSIATANKELELATNALRKDVLTFPIERISSDDSAKRLKWGARIWNSFLDWILRSRFSD